MHQALLTSRGSFTLHTYSVRHTPNRALIKLNSRVEEDRAHFDETCQWPLLVCSEHLIVVTSQLDGHHQLDEIDKTKSQKDAL